jgi:hypothetical protein
MVSVAVCGIATALTKVKIENSDVAPARSTLAARILMMSLVARYVVLRGCGAG